MGNTIFFIWFICMIISFLILDHEYPIDTHLINNSHMLTEFFRLIISAFLGLVPLIVLALIVASYEVAHEHVPKAWRNVADSEKEKLK